MSNSQKGLGRAGDEDGQLEGGRQRAWSGQWVGGDSGAAVGADGRVRQQEHRMV